jgi:hypothetical protein
MRLDESKNVINASRDKHRKTRTAAGRVCLGSVVALSVVFGAYAADAPKDDQPGGQSKNGGASPGPETATGKKHVWTLSTADTRITIGVDSLDRLAIYELTSPGSDWNWTGTAFVIPLPAQALTDDGATWVPITWRFQEALTAKQDTVTLVFACAEMPKLSLKSVWWASSARLPGPVQHTFLIENQAASAVGPSACDRSPDGEHHCGPLVTSLARCRSTVWPTGSRRR